MTAQGISDVAINLHYLGEQIREAIDSPARHAAAAKAVADGRVDIAVPPRVVG